MRRGDSEGEEGHSDFPDTQVVEGPVVREMVHWRGLVNAMVYSHQRVEDEDGHIRYRMSEADFDKAAATVYVSSRKDCCSEGLADVDTVVGGPGSRHSSDLSVDTVFAKEHNYLVDNGAGVVAVAVVVEVVEVVDRHIVAEHMEDNMTWWKRGRSQERKRKNTQERNQRGLVREQG